MTLQLTSVATWKQDPETVEMTSLGEQLEGQLVNFKGVFAKA